MRIHALAPIYVFLLAGHVIAVILWMAGMILFYVSDEDMWRRDLSPSNSAAMARFAAT